MVSSGAKILLSDKFDSLYEGNCFFFFFGKI
jgi:hypothetical protein